MLSCNDSHKITFGLAPTHMLIVMSITTGTERFGQQQQTSPLVYIVVSIVHILQGKIDKHYSLSEDLGQELKGADLTGLAYKV